MGQSGSCSKGEDCKNIIPKEIGNVLSNQENIILRIDPKKDKRRSKKNTIIKTYKRRRSKKNK